jgi:SAM-dependent methyltransferase
MVVDASGAIIRRMLDPRVQMVADGYDAMADCYGRWAAAVTGDPRDRYLAELTAGLADGAAVLDLGCGSGMPTGRMLSERFSVTGVDISAAQLARARESMPGATLLQADLSAVELPAASFDAVVSLFAITHVPRERHAALFARIAEWLRPGGRLLATLGSGGEEAWTGEWLGRPMHFSSHDPATSRSLIEAAGLRIVLDRVEPMHEPEGEVEFQWVLCERPAG